MEAVNVPISASLNWSTLGVWIKFAKQVEQAGADAIERNIYFIPTNTEVSGSEIENIYTVILREVKVSVHIPVAANLSPFFSNFASLAKSFHPLGAPCLVLFHA